MESKPRVKKKPTENVKVEKNNCKRRFVNIKKSLITIIDVKSIGQTRHQQLF